MDIKNEAKKYYQDAIESLRKWIQINSIYDQNSVSKDAPFGQGVKEALRYIANLALEDGFEVDTCEGYCTEISFGQGPLIAVYAHADVVPVSGTWKHEPFGAEIENEIMYGRGTSDDKGPGIAAFYALKALRDNNLINGYKVSLVFGGNEEKGGACLDHYFNVMHKPYPKYGFTPDADFPLIYGEKGISGYVHKLNHKIPGVKSITGGFVRNAVIDEAHAILEHDGELTRLCSIFFSLCGTKFKVMENDGYDE